VQGARAVQKSIIEEFPDIDMSISVVWIRVLPGDSESSAKESARMFNDHRVRQFYDPNQIAGKAIAERVGWKGKVAWDIYLFYPAGHEWTKRPPTPSAWKHQLRETWADREHFHAGDDLVKALFETMKKLTARQ
jgi:hypothetical protein